MILVVDKGALADMAAKEAKKVPASTL